LAKKNKPNDPEIAFKAGLEFEADQAKQTLKDVKAGADGLEKSFGELGKSGDKSFSELTHAVISLNNTIGETETKTSKVVDVLKGFSKIVAESFAIGSALLKPAIEVDNYLGVLNTKIANDSGSLERYRKALLDVSATVKDLRYGQDSQTKQEIQYGFSANASREEKLGDKAESNQKGLQEGVGGLDKFMGIGTQESIQILSGWHKQLGVTYEGMGPFTARLAAITRESNLTSKQIASLSNQVTGLGVSYGLTGERAKRFTESTFAMATGLSNAGIDAQNFIAKMNEGGQTGSEQGLISDLILGLNSAEDKEKYGLSRRRKAAQELLESLGTEKNTTVGAYMAMQPGNLQSRGLTGINDMTEMNRLAYGAYDEGTGKKQTVDAKAAEAKDRLNKDEKAGTLGNRYDTMAQAANQAAANTYSLAANEFKGAVDTLKLGIIGFGNTVDSLQKWLSEHGLGNAGMLGLIGVSIAGPLVATLGKYLLTRAATGSAGSTAAELAGPSAVSLLTTNIGTLFAAAPVITVIGAAAAAAASYLLFNWVNKQNVDFLDGGYGKDKVKGLTVGERVTRSYTKDLSSGYEDNALRASDEKIRRQIALETDPAKIEQLKKLLSTRASATLTTKPTLSPIDKNYEAEMDALSLGFKKSDKPGDVHAKNSAHYDPKMTAVDVRTKDLSVAEKNRLDSQMRALGYVNKSGLEVKPGETIPSGYTGGVVPGSIRTSNEHGHYEKLRTPSLNEQVADKPQQNRPETAQPNGLQSVHDQQANFTLEKIFSTLNKKFDELIAHAADAGTPSHPYAQHNQAVNSALAGHS